VADALPETCDKATLALLDEVYRTGKPYSASAPSTSSSLAKAGR
jgi:hypothetical protein